MFNKILIAIDGTPLMENVMKYTATIFPNSDFHVICVVDTAIGSIDVTKALVEILEERAQSALDSAEAIFQQQGINIVHKMSHGNPSHVIMEYVEKENIDLVVQGSSTKSGIVKFTFGHVGESLINNLKSPILIINHDAEIRIPMKILSPTDGKIHSKEAGEIAMFMAKHFKATLYKCYIGDNPQLGKKILDSSEVWAKEIGVKEINEILHSNGDPADKILKIASNYDLVVMGKGKKTILGEDILGFASRKVAALSPIPILLVGK